jgi:hypothetical protein
MTKIILPGAWELTQDVQCELFALSVPPAWRQVANSLAQLRFQLQGRGYPSVPVYSLDPLVAASFPQIIKTVRNGWQQPGVPWVFATATADLLDLPILLKDWLLAEFSQSLGENEVNSRLNNLNEDDWRWEEPITYSLQRKPKSQHEIDVRFQAIPDYLAGKFLENPVVSFGADNQYQLKFYRVVSLKGAELMSWPPYEVPLIKVVKKEKQQIGMADISFVIRFSLQTVPWRNDPIIYHHLSVRRWVKEPLIAGDQANRALYKGVKVHIGDNHCWLDGDRQLFCFIPVTMKRQGGELRWPRAIDALLAANDSRVPDPIGLAENPVYNWSTFGSEPKGIQAAIAYDTRQGEAPCLPGVSPRDLASLDQAIQNKVIQGNFPARRVGEAVRVSGNYKDFWPPVNPKKKGDKTPKDPNDLLTPMLRPKIAAPAVFRENENPLRTVLIVWETRQCRDALISQLCELLSLSPKGEVKSYQTPSGVQGEEYIYEGELGELCIKIQHVGDLSQNLDVGNFSVPERTRKKRRIELLEDRKNLIATSLPSAKELSGSLIEIRYPPLVPEADPKLAWRIGAMQAGYVNQHIHKITVHKKSGEEYVTESGQNRVKRAVSDLLRQFGILPTFPLIEPEKEGIKPHVWLTCFYALRRTRKTTASNTANTVVLIVRVNPVKGKVEVTTPSIWKEKESINETRWVSYPIGLRYFLSEKWDPDSYFDDTTEDTDDEQQPVDKNEQRLLNKFVADCLRDCLSTEIEDENNPRVLFMAEAQNARKMLTWLQNPKDKLPANNLPDELKRHITEAERSRLLVVRLRVADNSEVPVGIVKGSPGTRTSGLFRWQDVCDDGETALYLSIRKLLTTEQGTNTLQQKQSRLDNGSIQAGNPRLLEIAVAYHPGIEPDKLAHFVHRLRDRWPYFADEVRLPFPFPFAIKAKEYAVSARDSVESDALGTDEEG